MSEVPEQVMMWQRKKEQESVSKTSGVFSDLQLKKVAAKAKLSSVSETPTIRISFTMLINDVLPKAKKLEYKLGGCDELYFCLTGLEGTTPLMQWHTADNKASWFAHSRPRPVEEHNLRANAWNEVACVIPFPHLWNGTPHTTTLPLASTQSPTFTYYHRNVGFRYLFCLVDVKMDQGSSLCLFPSLLKSEFLGIRKTIEAYSNKHDIEEVPDIKKKGGLVAGIEIDRCWSDTQFLRVTNGKGRMNTYQIVLFE
jgi:hypothetical protein